MTLSAVDSSIVNVALPAIGRDFHIAQASVGTISIGYLVALAASIPASGWLGDRFGGKKVLLSAVVVFTLASALCGLATSETELVGFRILQGIGGGMLAPVGMAMLYRVFPAQERVKVAALIVPTISLAPVLGPVLGGLLVTSLSWRWVFLVNVPIGVMVILFGLTFVAKSPSQEPGHFDALGFALGASGLGLFMYGFSEGPFLGWGSTRVLATIPVGAGLIALLAIYELRNARPIVDVRLFANRMFRFANGLAMIAMAAGFGGMYIATLYFQDGRGLSPLAAGLNTSPGALGYMAGSQLVSRLFLPMLGPRRLASFGFLALIVALVPFSFAGATTNLWPLRALMVAQGLAMSPVFLTLTTTAFSTISPGEMGRASTIFNAVRYLGGAIGVAILTTAMVAVGQTHLVEGRTVANLASYHAAWLVAAGLSLVGAVIALGIKDADAAATIVKRVPRNARPDISFKLEGALEP
jgi:EmrB/QacA subfamily drug resistance transporter